MSRRSSTSRRSRIRSTDLTEVLSVEELRELQKAVREIYVDPSVADYIVRLVNATRTHPDVYLGASPRGSLALYRTGQALAALAGRDYVIPDDIKTLAESCLAHRLIIKTSSSMHDIDPRQVVAELLGNVPVDAARAVGPGPGEVRGPPSWMGRPRSRGTPAAAPPASSKKGTAS
jgi:MoxR-like ATPase